MDGDHTIATTAAVQVRLGVPQGRVEENSCADVLLCSGVFYSTVTLRVLCKASLVCVRIAPARRCPRGGWESVGREPFVSRITGGFMFLRPAGDGRVGRGRKTFSGFPSSGRLRWLRAYDVASPVEDVKTP